MLCWYINNFWEYTIQKGMPIVCVFWFYIKKTKSVDLLLPLENHKMIYSYIGMKKMMVLVTTNCSCLVLAKSDWCALLWFLSHFLLCFLSIAFFYLRKMINWPQEGWAGGSPSEIHQITLSQSRTASPPQRRRCRFATNAHFVLFYLALYQPHATKSRAEPAEGWVV